MDATIRVALSEAEFRDLVAGKVVRAVGGGAGPPFIPVDITLSDIGWRAMFGAVCDAMTSRVKWAPPD